MSLREFTSAWRLLNNFERTPLKSCLAKISITEFVLTLQGRGYLTSAPTGLWSKAQGWRAAPTLGKPAIGMPTPTGLRYVQRNATPLGLGWQMLTLPRVAARRQPWAGDRSPVGAEDSPAQWISVLSSCVLPECQKEIDSRQLSKGRLQWCEPGPWSRFRCVATIAFRLLVALLVVVTPLRAQEIYDLLLKNGHVIDLKNQRNGRYDIAVIGNKIARVAENIPASQAKVVIEAGQYYVTPGLIDIHTHFDAQGADLNLNPDHNALSNGVTTAVDAGSSGWKNFEDFKKKVISRSKTRLLAFLNIVGAGLYGEKVENDVGEMDAEAAARMVKKYPETIVGIKTAHFQPPTWDAVDRAVKAAELSNSIVMVDFHPKPGREYPELILKHMRPGDIHTHFYGRLTPQLDQNKKVQPYMWEARKRGILFDVGHGAGSFWFRIAVPAVQQGFLPDTISTDIHKASIMLARANMTTTMSKLLNIGLTLEQVIERSTVNPAKAIRRPELGTLSEGSVADIAVLELERGSFAFLDSGHGKLIGDKRLRCVLTVREGKVVWDTEGLSLTEWSQAGPYSNFK